jgi:hypothetical protein
MTKYTTLFLRRGDHETLHYSTEVLASGEPAVSIDSGVLKVGNGTDTWASLPSVGVPSNPVAISGASGILNMVQISQTDYDNIASPDPNTLYFIV